LIVSFEVKNFYLFFIWWQHGPVGRVLVSDVARPLSYKTKTTFSRLRPFFKDRQIINPRPKKTFPYRKNQTSYADFAQSCWYNACK